MSIANEVHAVPLAGGRQATAAEKKTPWWERRAVFRYGFVALVLIVWQIVGPTISPIFFTYPTKIAVAFYTLTANGELPYYLAKAWR